MSRERSLRSYLIESLVTLCIDAIVYGRGYELASTIILILSARTLNTSAAFSRSSGLFSSLIWPRHLLLLFGLDKGNESLAVWHL